ncbi:MAG: acylphosphatase [Desulfobulbaceae bacterium]|nr:acylphosphatase [Desulfobulbaceae bacterium]
MPNECVHIIVEGRVQGVFYRASTKEEASRLGLTGWVRNRPEGSVEAIIEGDPEQISKMIGWLHKGPPHATVTRVRVTNEESNNNHIDFTIRY